MDTGDFQVEKHYVLLIYPFRHTLEGGGRETLLRRLAENWQPWWRRFDEPDRARMWDDTYFFLPHLRELLFPETAPDAGPARAGRPPSAPTSTRPDYFGSLSAEEFGQEVSPSGVLRLTHKREQLAALEAAHLTLERKEGRIDVPLRLHWVDLILFPQSVGFLVLKVEMDVANPTLKQVGDFLYHIRMIHPPRLDWNLAQWVFPGKTPTRVTSRDFVDFLLNGIVSPKKFDMTEGGKATLDAWMEWTGDHGETSARISETDIGQVYGQSFHLHTYACLDASAAARISETPAGQSFPFESAVEQALYELATGTDTADPDYRPHPDRVKRLREQGLIALWANWQGMVLHDNVAYLGTEPSLFLLDGLAHNVETDYFHLYLLAFYQKMRLSFLSGELVRRDTVLHRNLNKASELWDDFMRFRNHYWFEEVTFKPQGIELYSRFQQALFARPLYETVSKEVRDLQEYYSGKATQRAATLIYFLTIIGLPVTLAQGLFSGARFHSFAWYAHDSGRHFLLTVLLLAAGFYLASSLWVRYFANLGQKSRHGKR